MVHAQSGKPDALADSITKRDTFQLRTAIRRPYRRLPDLKTARNRARRLTGACLALGVLVSIYWAFPSLRRIYCYLRASFETRRTIGYDIGPRHGTRELCEMRNAREIFLGKAPHP